MNIGMLAGPAIGAVIGYCTNYIAVKMLFRPLKPVMIGSFRLPFTPGIIPKGKDRLAKALGSAVGDKLLTEETLRENLLSDEMKSYLKAEIHNWVTERTRDQADFKSLALYLVPEYQFEALTGDATEELTLRIWRRMKEAELGNFLADAFLGAVREKVQGSFLALMINESLLEGFREPISREVERLIEEEGRERIRPMVESELSRLTGTTVGEAMTVLSNCQLPLEELFLKLYDGFVTTKLSPLLKQLNVKRMIERQVSGMDVLELEELVLSVMKKELNAVVNLGAVIGFLLGLLNLLFHG